MSVPPPPIFKKIDVVKAPSEYNVEITLGKTYQPFLRQLTYLATVIIPEGSFESQGNNPIGTRPFGTLYGAQWALTKTVRPQSVNSA